MKSNKLIYFSWLMLASLVIFILVCGCSKKCYPYEKENYQYVRDPLTIIGEPFKHEYENLGFRYVEPFHEDTICNHYFIHEAIPIDSIYDPFTKEVVQTFEANGQWSCICIYCHLKKMCY